MANTENVSFLALQFRVNKTTIFSFQQINQTTPWVQWHPIVSYASRTNVKLCVFCLAELNLPLKSHQPGPKTNISLSEPPVNHSFSFEGSLSNLSCTSHSRHPQGCCVFLEQKEVLPVFSSFAVPTQKPLAFLKKSWNTSCTILLLLALNFMGMWSEGMHQDQGHG